MSARLSHRPHPPDVLDAAAGAIAMATRAPDADVWAVAINDLALGYARVNAALADVPGVRAAHSDLLTDVGGSAVRGSSTARTPSRPPRPPACAAARGRRRLPTPCCGVTR
jgi:hypothetical protein